MINIEVKETKDKQDIKYPCLMIADNGEIVLFISKNCGTSFHKSVTGIGYYSDTWYMPSFKPFNGYIILSNKE